MRYRLYFHLVWTTLNRERLIDAALARYLVRFLRGVARKERAAVLAVGMVQTHIHVLLELHPTASIASVVKRLKGASSAMARREGHGPGGRQLRWAKGYAAHTVSARELELVRRYLESQGAHHPAEAIVGWEGDCVDPYDVVGAAAPLRPPSG
jgi:REP element-mobilizing transposase RayT